MPDRPNDLHALLRLRLQEAIAEANEAGRSTEDVLETLSLVLLEEQTAYDRDPDPADDPIQTDLSSEKGVPRAG
jgi:hypothetical protein